jgi:hypothetical protein
VLVSLVYSLLRALLDVIAISQGDQAQLQAEVLALRRQVQVLERQIKRVRWTPGDRMLMAALREHLEGHTYSSEAGYTSEVAARLASLRPDALRVRLRLVVRTKSGQD